MKQARLSLSNPLRMGVVVCIYVFGIWWPQHYTEESILESSISDPVFGGLWETQRHVVVPYFGMEHFHGMKQHARLELLVQALNVTISALKMSDIPAFIDAGVLLGWYRHNEKMIPWDIDADVGIDGDDCLKRYPNQSTLEARVRSFLPQPYVLEYLDCNNNPANGRGFAGIVADSRNGLKVDIFGFHTVDASTDAFSWRKDGNWVQRDLDRDLYHKVFPRDSIFPLKLGQFEGITGEIIPNDPKTVLQWDFGFVLDPPIFPHGISLKISAHPVSIIAVAVFMICFGSITDVTIAMLAALMLGGGFRVVSLVLAVISVPATKPNRAIRIGRALMRLACVMLLFRDFVPIAPQMFAATMEALGIHDFLVNKQRYCFLYKVLCVDT